MHSSIQPAVKCPQTLPVKCTAGPKLIWKEKFGNRVEGAVISYTRPMIMRVKMDAQELESGVATNDRGFNLNYQQIPCTASKADAINFT